jgi:DNA-binding XRE family transcriptional regulator
MDIQEIDTLPANERRPIVLRLAQNVVAVRQRVGLTQLQLADAADLSRATVHLIEAGACDPKLSTVASLALALGVKTRSLLFERL